MDAAGKQQEGSSSAGSSTANHLDDRAEMANW